MTKREMSQFNVIAKQAFALQVKRRKYEAEERILLDQLKSLCSDQTHHGQEYIYMKSVRKGAIAYDDIPELKRVNLEQYRKPDVAMWKLGKL